MEAAVSRARPIVLTSMTTFVGLMPLMFNTSVQAQFLVPMAVSLAFGVTFATVITLLVVPSIYRSFDDIAWVLERLRDKAGLGSNNVSQESVRPG